MGSEVSCRHFCYFLQAYKTPNSIQHAFGPNSSLNAPTKSYEMFNSFLTSNSYKLNWHRLHSGLLGFQALQRDKTFSGCISLTVGVSFAPQLHLYRELWLGFLCRQYFCLVFLLATVLPLFLSPLLGPVAS